MIAVPHGLSVMYYRAHVYCFSYRAYAYGRTWVWLFFSACLLLRYSMSYGCESTALFGACVLFTAYGPVHYVGVPVFFAVNVVLCCIAWKFNVVCPVLICVKLYIRHCSICTFVNAIYRCTLIEDIKCINGAGYCVAWHFNIVYFCALLHDLVYTSILFRRGRMMSAWADDDRRARRDRGGGERGWEGERGRDRSVCWDLFI